MKIVMWGTFDKTRPRNLLTLEACRDAGIETAIINRSVWSGVEDKSQITGFWARAKILLGYLIAYPILILRYLASKDHEAILVGYLGHLDVLVLWPFARMRGKRIVWDAFLSLYDTVVLDRKLLRKGHPLAWAIRKLERLACRAADVIVLDTLPHARFFQDLHDLPAEKFAVVPVGAEEEFYAAPATKPSDTKTVLFYGQFIPLHGIETIVEAARICIDLPVRWHLVGRGQELEKVLARIETAGLDNIRLTAWMTYDELIAEIGAADICLGIFGDSGKANRVVPNKVYQILAAGKPLITRDSDGMRWLFPEELPRNLQLVPAASPTDLARTVGQLIRSPSTAYAKETSNAFSLPTRARLWHQILSDPMGTQSDS